MRVLAATVGVALILRLGLPTRGEAQAPAGPVDATTLRGKVLCGYQGWFRCPGDGTDDGWLHWSRQKSTITPASLTFEMWPDTTEFAPSEKFAAPGFLGPDGGPAYLFSSARAETVARHFDWMERYGIDGVFVQRFLVNADRPSFDRVLGHVRASAARTGRAFAVCYDLSGARAEGLADRLAADWRRLVEVEKIDRDGRYLHHAGKPVVFVWGFFPDRFGPATAHRIIDVFKAEGPLGATLIGGCPWRWRAERDPEWARAYRRFDVVSPWNVGNATGRGPEVRAATSTWKGDLEEARRSGMAFLPVVYPGFAWTNLKGPAAAAQTIPRQGGRFYWRQFVEAADLGAEMAYVAMFDEVDEATAVFKVSDAPPTPGRFASLEGLPSDWYLRLTGEGSRLIRGEAKAPPGGALPIRLGR